MPNPSQPPSAKSTSSYGLASPIASTLAFAASFALPSSRSSSPSQASGSASAVGSGFGWGSGSGAGLGSSIRPSGQSAGDAMHSSRGQDRSNARHGQRRKKASAGGGGGWHDEAWDSGSDEDLPKGSGSALGLSGSTSTVKASTSTGFYHPPTTTDRHPVSMATRPTSPPKTRSNGLTSSLNNFHSAISLFGSSTTSNKATRPNISGSSSTPAIASAPGMASRNGRYRSVDGEGGVIEEDDEVADYKNDKIRGRESASARPIPMPMSKSAAAIRSGSSGSAAEHGDRSRDRKGNQNGRSASSHANPGGEAALGLPPARHHDPKPSSSHGSTSTISFASSSSFPSSYSPADGTGISIGNGNAGPSASIASAAAGIGPNGLSRAFSYTHISPPSPSNSQGSGSGAAVGSSLARPASGLSISNVNGGGGSAAIASGLTRANGSNSSLHGLGNGSGSGSAPNVAGGGADWTLLETREAKDAEKEYKEKGLVLGNGTVRSRGGMSTVSEGEDEDVGSQSASGIESKSDAGSVGKANGRTNGVGGKREKVGVEALRADHEAIMNDPLHRIKAADPNNSSAPPTPTSVTSSPSGGLPSSSSGFDDFKPATPSFFSPPLLSAELPGARSGTDLKRQRSVRTERRREKFGRVLRGGTGSVSSGGAYRGSGGGSTTSMGIGVGAVDPVELRQMAWSGVPAEFRPVAWQMLLNYLPLPASPRLATLARKRREYAQLVNQTFNRGMTATDAQIWHQIEIDVPRTRPGVPLWACETTQRSLERILYVWAIRHPASGYVQGINDLVTPFFEVFLSPYIDCDPELFDCSCLPAGVLAAIEADTFWCMSKLLDGIQDNYVSQQPGIHRLVRRMSDLIKRIDAPLAMHLEDQGVEFMQFAFRWMNCLLMREISVKGTIRMWDTYLSEGTDAFSQFHLYVCSAFLVKWSGRLQEMEFQDIIMFLQSLPTQAWTDHDIELLLSEAFVLKSVWQGAENHFAGQTNGPLGGGMGGR